MARSRFAAAIGNFPWRSGWGLRSRGVAVPTYYCHKCARLKGYISPIDPSELERSQYQLEKFIKHTAPDRAYPTNSVFNDSNGETYQSYMVSAAASGCLEIDDQGRKNLIYFAGKETALRYEDGIFAATCSGVTVVCGESSGHIHAFPSDFHPESRNCDCCGDSVPFDPLACSCN